METSLSEKYDVNGPFDVGWVDYNHYCHDNVMCSHYYHDNVSGSVGEFHCWETYDEYCREGDRRDGDRRCADRFFGT